MNGKRELRLARALYQLTIYLESLHLPFTLGDLYRIAYGELWEEMPGALWLDHLASDEYVLAGRDEFYTLKTIFETMDTSGLALLLEVIHEETAHHGIKWGVPEPGFYSNFFLRRRDEDPEA
ncbi:hypothetical protein [Tumebacillus permanentifrigoris]|uniref:Uncharacterized protein n=1 Tax=Tumebacillus permanentifrigoris TaxID=378543 RepID=A0A316DBH7_9BACL|nr:hypothetical protein [Tumebacillus permanentifrigoris]PWK15487.1 hypothetical protein C7459_10323 [Tumebacillus permanentifrigoris]